MKIRKYIYLLLFIAGLAAAAQSADVGSILQRREAATKLPDSDSAVLYHGTTFTIFDDGRMNREEHVVRYLRTVNAWDDYGDPLLAYDSLRQDLEITLSRTHTLDGRQVDTTPNGFNQITPFGLDLAPDLTHYHQVVVTHLGIEADATTELKYIIRDKEPLLPWAWADLVLGSHEPILERVVVVVVPEKLKLQFLESNQAPKAQKEVHDGVETYTWRMSDLAAVRFAENEVYTGKFLPRISFTTCPGWDKFTAVLQERLSKAALQDKAFTEAINAFKGISDAKVLLDSVSTFISNRIALKRFPDLGMLASFRPLDRIYHSGYASSADLALLYTSALKTLGFNPEVSLFSEGIMPLPGLIGDEKYVIRLTLDNNILWLFPADGSVQYRTPENVVMIGVMPTRFPALFPASPLQENQLQTDLEVTVAEDYKATGWIVLKTQGAFSRYETATEKAPEALLEEWIADSFSDLEIKDARYLSLNPNYVEIRANLSFAMQPDSADSIL
ncbi:MAG: DUF3857 domain-containing protein, partial [bacterium]